MDVIHKIADIARDIATEKGDFILCALIKRAEGLGLLDVVLSAYWCSTNKKKTLEYIAGKLREKLTPTEMMRISHIVVFPPTDSRVQDILQLVQQHAKQSGDYGHLQLSSFMLSGMPICQAHILICHAGAS